MSWQGWTDELRRNPEQAVGDLLRGAADIGTFERASPHEFLLAILPRDSRILSRSLLGEPGPNVMASESGADLPNYLDVGLAAWLRAQREAAKPPARKLGAYAAQLCEALQWPLYFPLPQTRAALRSDRTLWLQWLRSLTLSAYRDPEYDYWQVLAAQQADDGLQLFWHAFVTEAGRTRSARYLDLGLLALAKLPLSEEDSLRNLRLQVQALVNRFQHRRAWGTLAQEELAQQLRGVMARNLSLSAANYEALLRGLLAPLGEHVTVSVLSLLGPWNARGTLVRAATIPVDGYRVKPPGLAEETNHAVQAVRDSRSLEQAWNAIRPLLSAHEDFVHRSGDAYYFVRNLDRCARALCEHYSIPDQEIQDRLFHWIQLALHMDGDDPRLWMLWELALRKAGYPQRAQWVLWEMTRRFPDQLPCRVELARLLAESDNAEDQAQARRLLRHVLQLDPENLHAYSTLAQLAIRAGDWSEALSHTQHGLRIDPTDEISAVLLATAYARRVEPGDLENAIEHLQRFTSRYPGQLRAASYLRDLQRRQQSTSPGPISENLNSDQTQGAKEVASEVDPAWRAFAESIHTWIESDESPAPENDDLALTDRLLSLPKALRQALARGRWDDDVLDRYDAAAQREFPLEVRLWRYLQTLHSEATSETERDRARQAVESWLDAEKKAASGDSPSWTDFLTKSWQSMTDSVDAAFGVGTKWLKALLDRYHPLPPPLFS
ncbi:MAG: hypothetical protein MZV49_13560 [Rhodopseudomonas palustris]|nr:hypothetical protein [Rhodopseudomonas palustris]